MTFLTIEREGHLPSDGTAEHSNAVLDTAATQLAEYFDGSRRDFTVPVRLAGTAFQSAVWKELRELPFGGVLSYGAIGLATGRPTAGRAVGGAVGANPIPIIVPCHRVLAGNGLGGYAGGLPVKRALLAIEGIDGPEPGALGHARL